MNDRKMIAVLPLRNVGAAEDEFFAAGITDEILSRLASVRGLGVVSTGGSSPYRDQVRARAIGQDLGVDYILTGSVRWASGSAGSGRVRISPKLIRVEDETHLWADVYDRSIEDIFEIQSEIALNVVRELNAALLEPERQALEARPTDNPEAYQAYLRGIFAADSVILRLHQGTHRLSPSGHRARPRLRRSLGLRLSSPFRGLRALSRARRRGSTRSPANPRAGEVAGAGFVARPRGRGQIPDPGRAGLRSGARAAETGCRNGRTMGDLFLTRADLSPHGRMESGSRSSPSRPSSCILTTQR